VLTFIESRNQGDMDKRRSLDYIRRRGPLSLTQGKVAEVKIMLRPSSFDEVKKRQKENQVGKLKCILKCFVPFLSIGHRPMKRNATW
jgi:hypothetical protein